MTAHTPVSMEGRKRWTPSARRTQLLTVAEEVFTRLGYQGTAVDDIAAAAGVTRTLIYKYFPDKDAIYLECSHAARTEIEDTFAAAALAEVGAEEQLRAGIRAYFGFVKERGQRWDMLFGAGSAVAGPVASEVAERRYETAEKIAGLVKLALPHVDDETCSAFAHAISGACEQLAKWLRRHPEVSIDTAVSHTMATIWSGLESIAGQG